MKKVFTKKLVFGIIIASITFSATFGNITSAQTTPADRPATVKDSLWGRMKKTANMLGPQSVWEYVAPGYGVYKLGGRSYRYTKAMVTGVPPEKMNSVVNPPSDSPYCWFGGRLCPLSIFAVMLLPMQWVASMALWAANELFSIAVFFSIVKFHLIGASDGVWTAWAILRDLCNIAFIFLLLYASLGMSLRLKVDYKRIISRVIIVALLINFSMVIPNAVIDVSNLLALQIYSKLGNGEETWTGAPDIVSGIKENMGINFGESAWTGGVGSTAPGPTRIAGPADIVRCIVQPFFNVVFITLLMIFLLIMGLMFLLRILKLVYVIVASPLAFLSLILSDGGFWKEWKMALLANALYAPILMFLMMLAVNIYGGVTTSFDSVIPAGKASIDMAEADLQVILSGIMVLTVKFILGAGLLYYAATQANKFKLAGAEKLSGGLDWAKNTARRETIGRAARRLHQSEGMKNFVASPSGIGKIIPKTWRGGIADAVKNQGQGYGFKEKSARLAEIAGTMDKKRRAEYTRNLPGRFGLDKEYQTEAFLKMNDKLQAEFIRSLEASQETFKKMMTTEQEAFLKKSLNGMSRSDIDAITIKMSPADREAFTRAPSSTTFALLDKASQTEFFKKVNDSNRTRTHLLSALDRDQEARKKYDAAYAKGAGIKKGDSAISEKVSSWFATGKAGGIETTTTTRADGSTDNKYDVSDEVLEAFKSSKPEERAKTYGEMEKQYKGSGQALRASLEPKDRTELDDLVSKSTTHNSAADVSTSFSSGNIEGVKRAIDNLDPEGVSRIDKSVRFHPDVAQFYDEAQFQSMVVKASKSERATLLEGLDKKLADPAARGAMAPGLVTYLETSPLRAQAKERRINALREQRKSANSGSVDPSGNPVSSSGTTTARTSYSSGATIQKGNQVRIIKGDYQGQKGPVIDITTGGKLIIKIAEGSDSGLQVDKDKSEVERIT